MAQYSTVPLPAMLVKMSAKQVDLTLQVTQPFRAPLLDGAGSTRQFKTSDNVKMVRFEQHSGVAILEASGTLFAVDLADMDAATTPTANVFAHLWSGTCDGAFTSTKARKEALNGARLTSNAEVQQLYSIKWVGAVTAETTVYGIDGEAATIGKGDTLDVLDVSDDTDLTIVRDVRNRRCFALPSTVLPTFTRILNTDYELEDPTAEPEVDLTQQCEDVQVLYLVKQSFRAFSGARSQALMKQGHKVLLYRRSKDGIAWFRNAHGQPFCMATNKLDQHMLKVDAKSQAVSRPELAHLENLSAHVPAGCPPWDTHTYHTAVHDPEPLPYEADPVFDLPQTDQGLPLPPIDYVFPVAGPAQGKSEFGHYRFASGTDQIRATQLGLGHASLVMYAAQRGSAVLDRVLLEWVPGAIEGSQGAGFGVCNAYIHLWFINFRRKFWFGKGAVDLCELAVYTGTDEFWLERPGADGRFLDSLKGGLSYRDLPAPTEKEVETQVNRRQGFAAQPMQNAYPQSAPRDLNALAAKELLLHACNRQAMLGYPMINAHPIDGSKLLLEQTTFHSDFVDCGYHEDMHPINYQLMRFKGLATPLFLDKPLPKVNADGETRWTTVKAAKSGKEVLKEVMIEDLPCLPDAIDVDEDWALMCAFHDLDAEWEQIVARMDEDTRQGTNYYQNKCSSYRPTYGMPTKRAQSVKSQAKLDVARANGKVAGLTAHQVQRNNGRGSIPGRIDAGLPQDAILPDGRRNLVTYPDENHPMLRGTRQRADQKRWQTNADNQRREEDRPQPTPAPAKQKQKRKNAYERQAETDAKNAAKAAGTLPPQKRKADSQPKSHPGADLSKRPRLQDAAMAGSAFSPSGAASTSNPRARPPHAGDSSALDPRLLESVASKTSSSQNVDAAGGSTPAFEDHAPISEGQVSAFADTSPSFEDHAPTHEEPASTFGNHAPTFPTHSSIFESADFSSMHGMDLLDFSSLTAAAPSPFERMVVGDNAQFRPNPDFRCTCGEVNGYHSHDCPVLAHLKD